MKKLVKVLLPILTLSFLTSCSFGGGEIPEVKTYPVFFDGNGGTLVEGQELQFVHDPSEIVPPVYEKENYTFLGWDTDPSSVISLMKITAIWGEEDEFIVYFYGDGGTWVGGGEEKQIVKDASEIVPPVYEKEGYKFVGWSQDPSTVTSTTVIVAIWMKEDEDMFVVTFDGNGGDYVQGSLVQAVHNADEIVPPEFERPGYDLVGWNPPIETITGTTTVYAIWEPTTTTYTVTWKNYDGKVLETDENLHYGDMPKYDGATPTKPSTAQYKYTFVGWTPEVSKVTGNATYTATFKEELRKYTITWKNGDTTIETDEGVEYGTMPKYDGATPTKPSTAQYDYTFDGWTPEVKEVTGDVTYTAKFKENLRKYDITWKNGTTTLKTDSVEYGTTPVYVGDTPTKEQSPTTVFVWNGWTPEVKEVTGNATYTATFKQYDITNCTFEENDDETYTLTKYNGNKDKLEVTPIYNGAPITKIGKEAFTFCDTLKEIVIPDSVLAFGETAFSGCTSLTKINIPKGITEIPASAFTACSSLTELTIPENIVSMGFYAFYGCSALTTYNMLATTPPTIGSFVFEAKYKDKVTFYVPKGCASAYKTAGYDKYGKIVEAQ